MTEADVMFDAERRLEAWRALYRSRRAREFADAIRADDVDAIVGPFAFLGEFVADARLQRILASLSRDLDLPTQDVCGRLDRLSALALELVDESPA